MIILFLNINIFYIYDQYWLSRIRFNVQYILPLNTRYILHSFFVENIVDTNYIYVGSNEKKNSICTNHDFLDVCDRKTIFRIINKDNGLQ